MRPLSLPARSAGGIRQRAPAKEMFLANGKKKDKGGAAINHVGWSDRARKLLPSTQPASQSNQGQARKWRSDTSSVKTSPRSNVDQTPPEWSTPSYSKPNGFRQQFRGKELDSSGSPSPSYSKAKKSSQAARVERSQGRSQRSSVSYSKPNRPSQAARVERSKGGSQRSAPSYAPQSSRVERSKGAFPAFCSILSKPNRPSRLPGSKDLREAPNVLRHPMPDRTDPRRLPGSKDLKGVPSVLRLPIPSQTSRNLEAPLARRVEEDKSQARKGTKVRTESSLEKTQFHKCDSERRDLLVSVLVCGTSRR